MVGNRPLFNFETGGPQNGDIISAVQKGMKWTTVLGKRGDVLFFESYVPHKSATNLSRNSRRIIFLTFNALAEGDLYTQCYRAKRADFGNPVFHISTPTQHSAQVAI